MRSRLAVILLLAAVLLAPAAASAQEKGYPFRWSNFRIEASGGWIGVNPGDLDRVVDYENAYVKFSFLDRYAYYDGLYGDAYSAQFAYKGSQKFLPLRSGTPLQVALRYPASPTLGLSLGLRHFRGVQASGVALDVTVSDGREGSELPGASLAGYANDDLTLSVETWMPFLAANFGWDLLKFLRTEIVVLGGPIFGDLRVWNERHESVTSGGETVSLSSRSQEITGTETTLAVELAARLEIKIFPFLHVYGQAGYSFKTFNDIHGLNSIRVAAELPTPSQTVYSQTGPWGVRLTEWEAAWGKFSASGLTTSFGTDWSEVLFTHNAYGTAPAEVNLSGLQLQAGLSIRL